jgi:beta-glucanase (GH16 family)
MHQDGPGRAGFGRLGVLAVAVAIGTAATIAVVVHRCDRAGAGDSSLMPFVDNCAAFSTTMTFPDSTGLVVRARSSPYNGPTDMTLLINRIPLTTVTVDSTYWSDYTFGWAIPSGTHEISVAHSISADADEPVEVESITPIRDWIGDDFDGPAGSPPDSALWTVKQGTGWDRGVEDYTTDNARLDGQGNLVIAATKTADGQYKSGWVESTNKMSLGYGTTTARIKVPREQGLWPAFWLKGADEDITPWPESGEIDVLELPSTSSTVYSTLHGPIEGNSQTRQAQLVSNVADLSTDHHDYWVRHLLDEITIGIDDVTLGTFTPGSLPPGAKWVYNRPMHVIVNLAVGGPWAGDPVSSTRFPAEMIVDSVRWTPA